MAFDEKHPRNDVILHTAAGDEQKGQKVMAESVPVTMASNQPAIPVSVGAAASEGAVTEFLTDDGTDTGSHDMIVNGSGTPKSFTFPAHATRDIVLTGVRLVFSASFFGFDGATFGKGSLLANGVDLNIVANDGVFSDTLAVLTLNEDFLRLLQFDVSQAGSTDVMAATLPFQGRVVLEAGTSDQVEVVINDNLGIGSRGITYFTGTVYGILEPL